MAELIGAHDWAATRLGPIARWPQSLRVATRLLLNTRHPMFIFWGPELIQLYNDAYRDTMGPEQHPSALGASGQETWAEIWDIIGPQIEQVMSGGAATWYEDQLVPITRHGDRRAVWWTYSFSPIDDDRAPHGVGGVLVICRDVTAEHVARRATVESEARQTFLLALSDALRPLADPVELQTTAMHLIADHLGVMRASYFEVDADQDGFILTARFERNAAPIPDRMRLSDFSPDLAERYRSGRTLVFRDTETDADLEEQRAAYRAIGIRAWAAVPLLKGGRLLSIVGLHSATPRDWTSADIRILEDVAERTWEAVERVRAELARREIEEEQRLTVELVPALLWWADPARRDVSMNERWRTYTGQSEAETRDFGWLDAIHPDDADTTRAAFDHAFATGEPLECQGRIHNCRHGYRWHLMRQSPVRDEGGAITRWFGAATDVHELCELQDRQQVLVAELQHRTRNLMGVVRSMADKTMTRSVDLADFRARFGDRVAALARVQGLLSRLSEGERVTFGDLIRSEMSALGDEAGRIRLDGPEGVALRSSTVQTLALAVHELATNALKYGALGQPSGRLAITWHVDRAGPLGRPWLHVDWRESGVRMPAHDLSPRGGGSGRELIERALPYQLKAQTTYVIGADGVRCTIALPVSERRVAREAVHA